MPELPEVETVVRTLRPHMVGRSIAKVRLHRPDILCPPGTDLAACLAERTITSLDRRGKRIIFTLDNGHRFYIHLGMTGRLTVCREDEPIAKHTHLELVLDSKQREIGNRSMGKQTKTRPSSIRNPKSAIRNRAIPHSPSLLRFTDPRRFGGIWWLGTTPCDAGMGPEPLTLPPRDLAARLARTRRPIKSALLDQALIAGLGNIYVDESLFLSRIHPLRRTDTLKTAEVAALSRAIKRILQRAINHRGSTLRDYVDANAESGGFQLLHRVYDRKADPCPRCQTSIERIVLGGRSTHFCPKCQPASAARQRKPARSRLSRR